MDLQRRIRRNQCLLVTSGSGIQLFAFWSFFKGILYIAMHQDLLREATGVTADQTAILILGEVIGTVFIALFVLLYVHVGKSAIDEGKGRKKHKRLLLWAFLILLITAFEIFMDRNLENGFSTLESLASMLTDIVSLLLILQLIASTIFLRRNSGRLKAQ